MLKKLSFKEIVCYAISIFIAIVGLVFVILGIVGSNIDSSYPLAKVQVGFSWRWIGLIIIGSSVIFTLVVLLVNARKVDRITERELRRKQRLTAMMSDIKKEENTVIVENGKLTNPSHTIIDKDADPSLNPTGAKEN